jgi:hypothetical protein
MTRLRLIVNLLAGIVLVAILIGLVFILIDYRCSRNVSENEAGKYQQSMPFGGKK